MKEFLILLLSMAVIGLAIWLLSGLAGGLVAVSADFLTWLQEQWPGRPSRAPQFAMVTVFAAQRFMSLPFRLSCLRVDRKQATVKEHSFLVPRVNDGPRVGLFFVLPILDCVFLCLVVGAMQAKMADWSFLGSLGALLWIVPVGFIFFFWCMLARACLCPLFAFLTWTRPRAASGFRYTHLDAFSASTPSSPPPAPVWRGTSMGIVSAGTFLIFAIVHGGNPFLFRAVICFIVVDAVFMAIEEIVSFLLDWRNDHWVKSLAHQLTQDKHPDQRREAAEKLARLGAWATPVRSSVETALRDDSNPDVRTAARAALAHLG